MVTVRSPCWHFEGHGTYLLLSLFMLSVLCNILLKSILKIQDSIFEILFVRFFFEDTLAFTCPFARLFILHNVIITVIKLVVLYNDFASRPGDVI